MQLRANTLNTAPSGMRFFFARIFPLLFIVVGALLLYLGGRSVYRAKESVTWPVTDGRIQNSTVKFHQDSASDSQHTAFSGTYHAEILYAFTVEGQTHTGNRVAFGDYGTSNPSHARQIVNQYPKNAVVHVRYLPADPDVCLLEPGLHGQVYILPVSGLVFFMVGTLMAVFLPRVFKKQTVNTGQEAKDDVVISGEPLDLKYNNSGFLPPIGIHQRGDLFIQESSYSYFWLCGAMLLVALIVGVLPWSAKVANGTALKYWVAGGLAWGGICGVAPYWIRNALGQTIIIDRKNWTITIRRSGCSFLGKMGLRTEVQQVQIIPWASVLGLQLCYQTVPDNPMCNGYQLNLVWRDSNAQIQRHCLLKHSAKKFALSLGNQYSSLFGFRLADSTNRVGH